MSTIWSILQRTGNSFWFIEPDATVLQAAKRLHEKKIGALMVMEDERLIGIFSERDLVRRRMLQAVHPRGDDHPGLRRQTHHHRG